MYCEKCGSYHELQEDESVFDFDECSCGGKLKYTESREDLEEILEQISAANSGNVISRFWHGLSKKRKFGIFLGLFLILLALIVVSFGILYPKATPLVSTPPTGEFPKIYSNKTSNASAIEVRVITNSSWACTSTIYYLNGSDIFIKSLNDQDLLNGTGSQSFPIDGNPISLNIQVKKENTDDLSDITIQLVVNGGVVKSESTTNQNTLVLKYDFDPNDGFS